MKKDRRKILAKVAYLYFIKGKNQSEIAKDLNIYRTTISRMITKAKDEGIVKVEIKDFDSDLFNLEEYIQSKYGFDHVEIVPNQFEETKENLAHSIADAAAAIVRSSISENDIVGISWGATLSQMIEKIEPRHVKEVTFCPLAGGPSHINARYHVNTLVYEMARTFHGEGSFINATAIQENEELAVGITESKYFNELRTMWSELDLAIVGVGGDLDHTNSQWRDLLTKRDYKILNKEAAVGEVCCRFFDAQGNFTHEELQRRTIGLSLDQLSKVSKSIAIAQGENKARAILAILKKRYVNHLITDRKTILKVLEYDNDDYLKKYS
ncbi:sugar-binding transcriptional regulator [Amphibacillus sp. Q70]|uniref:sugar-binding transcriptional regulator n=1 Tax=Amphibacillus sp. Q70 TaxID=3453416 RepID=UPI003F85CE90